MNRVAEVNRELKRRGIPARLVAGKGYYYFTGADDKFYRGSWSVPVYRSNQLTVKQWLDEYAELEAVNNPSWAEF